MLNALWFKPDGGAEKYRHYLRAAGPIAARYGAKKLDAYVPEQAILGDFDAELVFFVQWPDASHFHAFVEDPAYQAIRHLREEAITRSLLIRCRRA